MPRSDRIKLVVADTLARVVVYGPLAVAAIYFSPISLIVIGLAAGQPWVGEGLGKVADWATKRYPGFMGPVNGILSHYAGMQWWKHAGVLIGALAVAIIPTPAIAAHLPAVVKTVVGLVGGPDSIWAQYVLPFAFATALPFATRMATDGFEWVFQKIPALRELSIQRQQDRRDRLDQRQADRSERQAEWRLARAARSVPSPTLPRPVPEGPAPAVATQVPAVDSAQPSSEVVPVPAADKPQPRLDLRRLNAPGREASISQRPRILPEVVILAAPPRFVSPAPRSTRADRGVAF